MVSSFLARTILYFAAVYVLGVPGFKLLQGRGEIVFQIDEEVPLNRAVEKCIYIVVYVMYICTQILLR